METIRGNKDWHGQNDSIKHNSCKQKRHHATNIPSCNQVSRGSFWFAFTFAFASREEFVDLQVGTGWGTLE